MSDPDRIRLVVWDVDPVTKARTILDIVEMDLPVVTPSGRLKLPLQRYLIQFIERGQPFEVTRVRFERGP